MILAIDSSALVASVALADEENIIAEYTTNMKKTHSQTILPMIDEIISMTGVDKKEIEAVAVTKGPGSFTGLRIGAATAKGLALALDIPVVGISTLEVLANNYNHCNKLICPMLDARRDHVFTAVYKCEGENVENVMEDTTLSIEELVDELNNLGQEVIIIGDGATVQKKYIDEHLKVNCFYGKHQFNRQSALALIPLAYERIKENNADNPDTFAPDYLRMSQAERERMENKQ